MPMVKKDAFKNLVDLLDKIENHKLILSYTKPLLEQLQMELMETMRVKINFIYCFIFVCTHTHTHTRKTRKRKQENKTKIKKQKSCRRWTLQKKWRKRWKMRNVKVTYVNL